VEVDGETGEIEILRYIAVDDVGNVINPMIVDGQVHGGVAQGIGQALYEHAIYDENGQLTSGSMMDYTVPNATQIPFIETERTVTPSPVNPMGLKGVGETGTIAATQAVVNAVVDALAPLGIRQIEMPLTPERVWRAIQEVRMNTRAQAGAQPAAPGGQATAQSRSYPERGEQGVPIQDERPAPGENEPFEGQGLTEDRRDEDEQ
jgi:xanthine dehydrogenase molybdopterin-binding subunit B